MNREDRIKRILNTCGLTQAEFADKIGVSQQSMSYIFTGKKKAGEKILLGILDNIEGINPLWLFTGKGEMVVGDVHSNYSEKTIEDIVSEKVYERISPRLEIIERCLANLLHDLKNIDTKLKGNSIQ